MESVKTAQNIECTNCHKQSDDCSKTFDCCCKSCFQDANTNTSILQALSKGELDYLVEGKHQINYKPGETIIKQNTSSTYVVCVREGLAKVYVEGVRGKSIIIRLISNQDFVTGGGLFNGNIQKFTISAITPVTVCLLDSSKLAKLFSENNNFSVELLRHHTKQNNSLVTKLVNLTQKYMPGRVADTLLYLKNEIYKSNTFSVPLTRQDLSEMSNMTKESVVRILQQFKTSGLIKVSGNTFEIIDENGLRSISRNG